MAGSIYGKILQLTTFGESHGAGLGVVVDGFPAGMAISPADIQPYLDRRRPGQSAVTTSRNEPDAVELLSGVFDGRTTGAPIAMLIRNTAQRSGDYEHLKDCYRPAHADFGFEQKFGLRDHRGGGRSSGRETAARVAAGALCQKLLREMGIDCCAYTESIGPVRVPQKPGEEIDREAVLRHSTAMPDDAADEKARAYIEECRNRQDSTGGVVACAIKGVPAGIGDPVFDKLDACLAKAVMSIGAVKAVEIGDGVLASQRRGSENNDAFAPDGHGGISTRTNHAGGILGGMSDGAPILLRAHFKPTPSIAQAQDTVDRSGAPMRLSIEGRHDPVVVPRAVVVVEAMCAITVLDALLVNMSARADRIVDFYASRPSNS